jgi:hypothetical protein
MVNQSKKNDPRYWKKWKESGAIGDINGRDYGEAYAFFNCKAPITQIGQELPTIMDLAQTPKRLEFCLSDEALPFLGKDCAKRPYKTDRELVEIALDARKAGIRYVLAARCPPNITNHQTADELGAILNQAYQSPLYQEGEQFRGDVIYKEDGRYVSI